MPKEPASRCVGMRLRAELQVLAMDWVTLMGRQPSRSIRLTDVRCFAQHLVI
ncbi:hypothetical protein GHK63_24180 [Sinorhizobium meliloti]|nr:hypothetical protein [Sinorhizobium meliloti]